MGITLDFGAVLARWPMLLGGAWMTLELAAVATLLGFAIGVVCAVGRRGSVHWVARICGVYIELVRNTPFLVQIFLVYFGLSSLGLSLPAVTVAIAALCINVGAYSAEIVRAGLDSVARGQVEAGETLGLSRLQVYRHIIFPPAVERVWPALTSQFVLLMLASSVCSQISAEELTAAANFIQSDTYRAFETYIIVAVMYVVLSLLLRAAFWALGQVLFVRRRRLGTAI
jgi:polar amino acid transport system permease protein